MDGFQYLAVASNVAMDILSASPDLYIQVSSYIYVTPWSHKELGLHASLELGN